jgi:hypothetical protein
MCEEFLIVELYPKFKVNTNFLPTLKYTAVLPQGKVRKTYFFSILVVNTFLHVRFNITVLVLSMFIFLLLVVEAVYNYE